jgi:phytoene synthase
MDGQTQTWEPKLLSMAYEARPNVRPVQSEPVVDRARLQQAYRSCRDLTARHSRTFYLASSLLPRPKQQAVRALYAVCRVTDDLVDEANGEAEEALAAWHHRILAPPRSEEENPVAIAWADTQQRYGIPRRYIEQLFDGVESDLQPTRYATFADLTIYAYKVASTVGLMSMHIIGFSGQEAIPYAVKLGVALQITNILRDIGEDWRAGRLYLPTTELESFGLAEADLAAGQVDARWRAFMHFQIERNRQLYQEACHITGKRTVCHWRGGSTPSGHPTSD